MHVSDRLWEWVVGSRIGQARNAKGRRISTWDTGGCRVQSGPLSSVEQTHCSLQNLDVWSFQKCSSGWAARITPIFSRRDVDEVGWAVKQA